MACAIEMAEPVRTTIPVPTLTLSELRDMLDALENQGADEELIQQIARFHLARMCDAS